MPGLFLYDFGDMVRAAVSPAAEDERDLSKVEASEPVFEALVRGTVAVLGDDFPPADRDRLVLAGKVITFEIGLRFLTDHLDGDVYFRVHREGHNLDRARTQFALVRSLEEKEDGLQRLVSRVAEAGEAVCAKIGPRTSCRKAGFPPRAAPFSKRRGARARRSGRAPSKRSPRPTGGPSTSPSG